MAISVKDVGTGSHNQIVHAAEVLSRSAARRKVFEAICRGKQKVRTAREISAQVGLSEIRVLQEALVLSNNGIIRKYRIKGKGLVYEKDPFYCQNRSKILRFALNKKAREKFPTSYRQTSTREVSVERLSFPKNSVQIKQLTIDDIDSFSKVPKLGNGDVGDNKPMDEKQFKDGLKNLLGEKWKFQDWGGEKNDFFSTRLRLGGKRVKVAFALKGRATKQPLTPKKMGKHGDQIQRLLASPADVFFVQFWGHIDESIIEEMRAYATTKSWAERRRIWYGIIDGQDTQRMLKAYKEMF